MKRSKPLRTKTRLRRRTPLRPMSAKREAVAVERRALVALMLAAFPVCQRCHVAASVDCHERLSRARGGSILEASNIACLCRPCHDWVGTHPHLATKEGWLVSAYGSSGGDAK